MMPLDNLELVRSICVAHEGGDFSSAEWAHPQIEFIWIGGPEEGSWTGVGALAERWGSSSALGRTSAPLLTSIASLTMSVSSCWCTTAGGERPAG